MYSKFRKLPKWTMTFTAAALLVGTIAEAAVLGLLRDAPSSTPIMAVSAITAPQCRDEPTASYRCRWGFIDARLRVGMIGKSVPYGYVDRVYEQALYHGRAELQNYGILGLKSPGIAKAAGSGGCGERNNSR